MSDEARNVAVEESKLGSQNSDDTLVVLEFSPKAPPETKEWLTALIKAPGVLFFRWELLALVRNRGGFDLNFSPKATVKHCR